MRYYKRVWPHPVLVNDRINRRLYADDSLYDVNYPDVALLKGRINKEEREARLARIQNSNQELAKEVLSGRLQLTSYAAQMKVGGEAELVYKPHSTRALVGSSLFGAWKPRLVTPQSSAPPSPFRQGNSASELNSPVQPRMPYSALVGISRGGPGQEVGKSGGRTFSSLSTAGDLSEQESENDGASLFAIGLEQALASAQMQDRRELWQPGMSILMQGLTLKETGLPPQHQAQHEGEQGDRPLKRSRVFAPLPPPPIPQGVDPTDPDSYNW